MVIIFCYYFLLLLQNVWPEEELSGDAVDGQHKLKAVAHKQTDQSWWAGVVGKRSQRMGRRGYLQNMWYACMEFLKNLS